MNLYRIPSVFSIIYIICFTESYFMFLKSKYFNRFTNHRFTKESRNFKAFFSMKTPTEETDFESLDVSYESSESNESKFIRTKFRQHVNPLASTYQQPIILEDNWLHKNFINPNNSFTIDIGCSKGSWALNMSESLPSNNFLGIEIRRPVVDFANHRKMNRNLQNVHFISTNVNVNIDKILKDINLISSVDLVCIQFPDPHFKKRHKKRRVVDEKLVDTLSIFLPSGCKIFLQSDVFPVIEDMVKSFSDHSDFSPCENYFVDSLCTNISPFHVQTEREISTLRRNLPVYRMLFMKK